MGARKPSVLRDFGNSPFPLRPIWDVDGPAAAWHEAYPEGVPPRVEFDAVRVERLLHSAADQFPDRTAIRYFRTAWTYAELLSRVRCAAGQLRKLGVEAGDRVMLVLPNSPEFIVIWFATHWLGAEIVPANPLIAGPELAEIARQTNVKVAVGLDVRLNPVCGMTTEYDLPSLIVASLAPHLPAWLRLPYMLQSLLHDRGELSDGTTIIPVANLFRADCPVAEPVLDDVDCVAVLQPTGGTTGVPKLAMLSHRNLCSNVAQLHSWSGMESGEETFLSVLPYFHIYGATCAMLSPMAGASTLLVQARFHPKLTLGLIRKFKPGAALLVPFMIAELNNEMKRRSIRLDCLKLCMSGASPLSEEVAREFEELTGATIMEGFGLSEASPVTHSNPADGTSRIGSIGLPLPNTEVRLVDVETGHRKVEPGEVGELTIRGPQVMQGYLDNPEETAIALRDGWLFTGDLAVMSDDGFFEIVDRKKDMIISGGLNVYPTEVEEVVLQHPAVERCAVVGLEDEKYGERVCAFVVPASKQNIDVEEIREFCRERLSAYKIPKDVRLCDELPETFLGKIRRVDLRRAA